jgi:hypothetical protein
MTLARLPKPLTPRIRDTWLGRITAEPCNGERSSDEATEKKDAEPSVLDLARLACHSDNEPGKGDGDTDDNMITSFLTKTR